MRIPLLSWLLLIPFCLIFIRIVSVSSQCLEDQRALLLQLRESLEFTAENSTKLAFWNQNEDCCRWGGVRCDAEGRVVILELDGESITGGVENATSLFSLKSLQMLNLAFNSFGSVPIPKGISSLTNLTRLNLSNAGFSGQIPIELGSLSKLVVLDLSTLFNLAQPLKLENPNLRALVQNLPNLEELYLDSVDISAERSEWCQAIASFLPKLSVMSLKSCEISGPLDDSLSGLRSLSVIRLDSNNLSTTVPNFFAEFSNLTILMLSSCNLLGTFPGNIFQVTTLQVLDLRNNDLLQGSLQQFPRGASLETLALSYTNFSGSIPDSIGNLSNLSRIELSKCNFSGPIPDAMETLAGLVYLDFSSNNFTGLIPSFQKSKNLSYIDLSRNNLTGPLSADHFTDFMNLFCLNLGFNSLNGSIPSPLFSLPSIRKLQLPNNRFSGEVDGLRNVNSSLLDTIDLSANCLNGSIPESFFGIRTLNVLSLSSNFFSGTIQLENIKNLRNLTRLELSYNNVSIDTQSGNSTSSDLPQLSVLRLASCKLQTLPDLRNQSIMAQLDLSNNQIEGEVPNWIWELGDRNLIYLNLSYNLFDGLQQPYKIPSLLVLDLHCNRLQGEIPLPPASAIYVDYSGNTFTNPIPSDIWYSLSSAFFFSLSNNNLTGSIHESVCNATYLQVLDLSNNSLSGKIPTCLVNNMGALGVLNLARNSFSGNIPDTFPVRCNLKTLDLSRNAISGKIPQSLINCTLLEVLNVENNDIEDAFPCRLKNSSSLRVLVLRSNKLYGDVNCSGEDISWPELQIIDIALNNFNGTLTQECFKSWRRMITDDGNTGDHLRFGFLALNHYYYQDTVTVTMKGLQMELVKILMIFTSIDFSGNNFTGEIPGTIGELKSLYGLNLSHNSFSGSIPSSIGELTNLQSLDLSVNELSGSIPATVSSLTFLSFLNLSFNNLSGMIPSGSQIQTFAADAFLGNAGLCGFPLNKNCTTQAAPNNPTSISTSAISTSDVDWESVFTGLGLGVGAAIIFAHLVFCKNARDWLDNFLNRIFLQVLPSYRFSYIRYDDSSVHIKETIEDTSTEDSEDFEEDDISNNTPFGGGRYCVFCTKLDGHRAKAIHDLKCTCHNTPPFSLLLLHLHLHVLY